MALKIINKKYLFLKLLKIYNIKILLLMLFINLNKFKIIDY